jgi:hypothetical protein
MTNLPPWGGQTPGQPQAGQPWADGPRWQQPAGTQPGYWQAGYGQPPPALAPGAVPLRPLGVGDILSGSFTLIRQNPAGTLGLTASTVTALAISLVLVFFIASQTAAWVGLLGAPLVLVFFGVQLGGLVAAMGQSLLGHKITIRDALRRSRAGWVILALLTLAVPFIGGWTLLGITLKGWGVLVALLLTAWLAVMVSLTIPVVVLEKRNPFAALGRSWRLVLGSYWRVFGIYVLMYLIMWVLSFIVSIPLDLISGLAGASFGGGRATLTLALAALTIGEIVITSLALTIETGVVVLVYADMRMRKEGMDLVLQQAVLTHQLTGEEFAATGMSSAYTGGAYAHGAYPGGPYPGGAYPGASYPERSDPSANAYPARPYYGGPSAGGFPGGPAAPT